jgi:hypothetical protein
VMGKQKFRLLLQDILNTRELLKRKNMDLQNYICVLCNTKSEKSMLHLFFECLLVDGAGDLLMFNGTQV